MSWCDRIETNQAHTLATTGASPIGAAAHTHSQQHTPPGASSSAPPACPSSCRAPCRPCHTCPPRSSPASRSSPFFWLVALAVAQNARSACAGCPLPLAPPDERLALKRKAMCVTLDQRSGSNNEARRCKRKGGALECAWRGLSLPARCGEDETNAPNSTTKMIVAVSVTRLWRGVHRCALGFCVCRARQLA